MCSPTATTACAPWAAPSTRTTMPSACRRRKIRRHLCARQPWRSSTSNAREMLAGCGKMILGSDSHTRYGALGTMASARAAASWQSSCWAAPTTWPARVWWPSASPAGPATACGPHDVAIALVGGCIKNGYVKNKVMEFVGPGIALCGMDYRNGIDVMTTETPACPPSGRPTRPRRTFWRVHGRAADYKKLARRRTGRTMTALSRWTCPAIRPMIALPMHPSDALTLRRTERQPGGHPAREVRKGPPTSSAARMCSWTCAAR